MQMFYYANNNGKLETHNRQSFGLLKIAKMLSSYTEEEFSEPGGMIVCSTDVNSNANRGILGFLKGKWETYLNRFFKSQKVKETIQNFNDYKDLYGVGYSEGNLFKGSYYDRKTGVTFNEKSFSVDLRGLPVDIVKKLAVEMCKKFNQQSVLFVNHENNRSSLIYP